MRPKATRYDSARNRAVFDSPEIVDDYRSLEGLSPCEQVLFECYIPRGSDVLDLGVGAGRTVEPLRARAGHYVGVDYAPKMIEASRARFPGVELHVADATDLTRFARASFDAVVFSFNGMGGLYPDRIRHQCIEEIHRVLRPDGTFVFSVHNPAGIFTAPRVAGLSPLVAARRFAREGLDALSRGWRVMRGPGFRGDGYVVDPVHGGLVTHVATPRRVTQELIAHAFEHLETLPSTYPRRRPNLMAIWYYYAFRRRHD
jgi:SAM-dependent methyltransferase